MTCEGVTNCLLGYEEENTCKFDQARSGWPQFRIVVRAERSSGWNFHPQLFLTDFCENFTHSFLRLRLVVTRTLPKPVWENADICEKYVTRKIDGVIDHRRVRFQKRHGEVVRNIKHIRLGDRRSRGRIRGGGSRGTDILGR